MTASDITGLLVSWSKGDNAALEKLLPLVEKELHQLAHRYMRRERAGHALQTTALINETYIRLVDQKRVRWQNRAHFFGIAGRIMRRILLNYVRDKNRLKRGGGLIQVSFSEALKVSEQKARDLIALDDALQKLAAFDERKSKVVELRYFGGLSVSETAEFLNVSSITVTRDWNLAKAWLAREISCH